MRYPGTRQTRPYIAGRIAAAAEWARRQGVPVWVGEFGAYPAVAPPADRLLWLRDVRDAFERSGIGWAVWSYDESLGLDRRRDPDSGRVTIDWASARALGLTTPDALAKTPVKSARLMKCFMVDSLVGMDRSFVLL